MEKAIKAAFNDTILHEAMRRYAIAPDQIRLLDGFESFVYAFERGLDTYILRIAHSRRRSEALIRGEVDWINHLAAGGASVARAVPSARDHLVESIDDASGGQFLATAFVAAPGRPPWEAGWTPALYEAYGRLLGKMHALTKQYVPASTRWTRPQWDEGLIEEIERNLPASEAVVVEKFRALLDYLRTLPIDGESYGLVHYDAHGANLFVDDRGTLTLFDFDDCVYSWFANDLAIVLFYRVHGVEEVAAFTQRFMAHFLRGYSQENHLDPHWLSQIPHFLKLREIDLYAVIHRSYDVDAIDDPWTARYMHNRKQRIEHDVPYIDFDFTSLSNFLAT